MCLFFGPGAIVVPGEASTRVFVAAFSKPMGCERPWETEKSNLQAGPHRNILYPAVKKS
jgi:hypothetical protein